MLGVSSPRVPEGLRDLMKNLIKEMLKENPSNMYQFSVQYFESMIQGERDFEFRGFEPIPSYESLFKPDPGEIQTQAPFSLINAIVPEELIQLIKEFIKVVLSTNPSNICKFAVEYFRNLKDQRPRFVLQNGSCENYFKKAQRFPANSYAKCICGREITARLFERAIENNIFEHDGASSEVMNFQQDEQSKFANIMSHNYTNIQYHSRIDPETKYINAVLKIQSYFRRFMKKRKSMKEETNFRQKYTQFSEEKAAFIIQRTLRKLLNKTIFPKNQPNVQINSTDEIEKYSVSNKKYGDIKMVSPELDTQLALALDKCTDELNEEAVGIKCAELKISELSTYKDIYSSNQTTKENTIDIQFYYNRDQAATESEKENKTKTNTKSNTIVKGPLLLSKETSAECGKKDMPTLPKKINCLPQSVSNYIKNEPLLTCRVYEEKSKSGVSLANEDLSNVNGNFDEDKYRKDLNHVDANNLNSRRKEIETELAILPDIKIPEFIQPNITPSCKEVSNEGKALIPSPLPEVECLPRNKEVDQLTASRESTEENNNSLYDTLTLEVISEDILEETLDNFEPSKYSNEIIPLASSKVSGAPINESHILKTNCIMNSVSGNEIKKLICEEIDHNFESSSKSADILNLSIPDINETSSDESPSEISKSGKFVPHSNEIISIHPESVSEIFTDETSFLERNANIEYSFSLENKQVITVIAPRFNLYNSKAQSNSVVFQAVSSGEIRNKIPENFRSIPYSYEIISIPLDNLSKIVNKKKFVLERIGDVKNVSCLEMKEDIPQEILNKIAYNTSPHSNAVASSSPEKVPDPLNNEFIICSAKNTEATYDSKALSNVNVFKGSFEWFILKNIGIIKKFSNIDTEGVSFEEITNTSADDCKPITGTSNIFSMRLDKIALADNDENYILTDKDEDASIVSSLDSNKAIIIPPEKVPDTINNEKISHITICDVSNISSIGIKEVISAGTQNKMADCSKYIPLYKKLIFKLSGKHNYFPNFLKIQDKIGGNYNSSAQLNETISINSVAMFFLEENEDARTLSKLENTKLVSDGNLIKTPDEIGDNYALQPHSTENISETISNEKLDLTGNVIISNPSSSKKFQEEMSNSFTLNTDSNEKISTNPDESLHVKANENIINISSPDIKDLSTQDKIINNCVEATPRSNKINYIPSDEVSHYANNEKLVVYKIHENEEQSSHEADDKMPYNNVSTSNSEVITSIPFDKRIEENIKTTAKLNDTISIAQGIVYDTAKNEMLIVHKTIGELNNLPSLVTKKVNCEEDPYKFANKFSVVHLSETATHNKEINMVDSIPNSGENIFIESKTNKLLSFNLVIDRSEQIGSKQALLADDLNLSSNRKQNTGPHEIKYDLRSESMRNTGNKSSESKSFKSQTLSDQYDTKIELLTGNCRLYKSSNEVKEPPSANHEINNLDIITQNFSSNGSLLKHDGKHIAIRYRKEYGSYFYNYKGFHSVILLAVVDANYKFLYVNVGTNGRANDAAAFNESSFSEGLKNNEFNIPQDSELPGSNQKVPFVFVADDAFKLTSRILKPHGQRSSDYHKIFNYRLSRARRVVENAFGILANRFQIFQRNIDLPLEKIESLTLAACALHNFIRTRDTLENDLLDFEDTNTNNLIEGSWRNEAVLTHLQRSLANRSGVEGRTVREIYTNYFNTIGSVP